MNKLVFRGTVILTASALIIKILSAVYRLPYQNLAGDVGFYVYQQAYPFFALAGVMGGFGFPVILSKLAAEKTDVKGQAVIFKTAAMMLGAVGGLLFLTLFLGAPSLADWMGDPRLAPLFRLTGLIFLVMPMLALLRGYFQGVHYWMLPTGVSQVAEQTVRVTLILGLSFYLFSIGAGPYAFGSAAVFGSAVAPYVAAVILLFFYMKRPRVVRAKWRSVRLDGKVAWRLLAEGLAYTLTALSVVFFQFSDVISLVPLLTHAGVSEAKALKGIYDRAYPLIQMGMTFSTALTAAMIPVVAKITHQKDEAELRRNIQQALRWVILLGGAQSVGLFSIIKPLNIMLFKNGDGTLALGIMALSVVFASLVTIGSGLLQSLGLTFRPVLYVLAAFLLKLVLNIWLVPKMEIMGAALATLVGLSFLTILVVTKIRRHLATTLFTVKEWMALVISLAGLWLAVFVWIHGTSIIFDFESGERGQAAVVALSSVALGVVVYGFSVLKLGLVTIEDVKRLRGHHT